MTLKRFVALYDLHFGYERRNRHKYPLHDMKAFRAALAFVKDFKPDTLILGGDMLDCGAISHHNHKKPGLTEGMRIKTDAEECRTQIIEPLERALPRHAKKVYLIGNHEDWLEDVSIKQPALEGLLDLTDLLGLQQWTVVEQGGFYNLGKLTFIHGDQLGTADHIAKKGVLEWERSVRFGHNHTFQAYTKTSALYIKLGRTGIAVPCLCTKDPKYGEGKSNRWMQGFLFGYLLPDGTYRDFVAIIVDGVAVVNGKVYRG